MQEQIIYKKISELKNNPNNPRKNDNAVDTVAKSIQKYGFRNPLIVDDAGIVWCGNTRLKAAKKLKLKEVPCIVVNDLTEQQMTELALLDNKTNEIAEWDTDMLSDILKVTDLSEFDLDWNVDLDIGDIEKEPEEDDFDIDKNIPEQPKSKLGDIYQLGNHRLMCGDSTKKEDVAKLMDGNLAELILSDPPYGMFLDTDFSSCLGSLGRKNHTQGNKYDKVIGDNEDFKPELIYTFFDNFNYAKEVFLFGADYFAELLPNKNDGSWLVWDKRKESQADAIGSEFELIWSKSKHKRRVLRHDWFGFLSSQNTYDAQHRVHPTQKPVSLLVDILQQWSKDSKNIVDLYGGSGSTLIACEQLDRICYMMELDPKYVDVIIARWENLTGRKAIKIN